MAAFVEQQAALLFADAGDECRRPRVRGLLAAVPAPQRAAARQHERERGHHGSSGEPPHSAQSI